MHGLETLKQLNARTARQQYEHDRRQAAERERAIERDVALITAWEEAESNWRAWRIGSGPPPEIATWVRARHEAGEATG